MFVHTVCEVLSERHPGRIFCFTMDNLNVHKNVLVIQEIMNHGYRVVFRAPYWSCDGAIEYVFCTIHSYLLKHHGDVANLDALEHFTNEAFNSIPTFAPYFEHVGL